MPQKRAMTSEHARQVKQAGHRNEHDFASLIGGEVNLGARTDKKDVIDAQHRSHSVKAGTWWQVFLYSRERLKTNTIFQGLGKGNLAEIMISCLDCYPEDRKDYLSNKTDVRLRLQKQMRNLLAELDEPRTFRAFLDKALFDGGNADYLSIFPGPARKNKKEKTFHIFHKDDVVKAISSNLTLRNSKARNANQMDDQKVIFWSMFHRRNMGEIEDRHDSPRHYREMKCRLNAKDVFEILTHEITKTSRKSGQVIAYGKATRTFGIRESRSPSA